MCYLQNFFSVSICCCLMFVFVLKYLSTELSAEGTVHYIKDGYHFFTLWMLINDQHASPYTLHKIKPECCVTSVSVTAMA
jgi:hypothetical protein